MTQEEKQLLLKDLCARLPYGVIVKVEYYDASLKDAHIFEDIVLTIGNINKLPVYWVSAKPYLRPMSSMTEEEKEYCGDLILHAEDWMSYYDYLDSRHLDYRGLIEKGLALEAPVDMYKTE